MNSFVEKIISLLSSTSLSATYSPRLVKERKGIAAVQLLPNNQNTMNTLGNQLQYSNVNFSVLVKGTESDESSLQKADEVFNRLHNIINESFAGGTIINIDMSTPYYGYTTDKNIHVYIVNGFAQVQPN